VIFTLGSRGMPSWDDAQIVAQSLRTGTRRTLVPNATDGRYLPSGHLVFGRGGVLFAVPFDVNRLSVVGEPVTIVEGVRRAAPGTTGAMHYAVSDTGTLVYFQGPITAASTALQLGLFDRTGAAEPLSVPLGPYNHPRLSPKGTQVAIHSDDGKESQVWVYGLSKSSAARRLTFGGRNSFPIWSADGQRVTFQSTRDGDAGIWWQRADGTDNATRVTRPDAGASHVPKSWSPDGRHLLFDDVRGDQVTLRDFSLADGKSVPFSSVSSDVPSDATFSPDGHWVAYTLRMLKSAQGVIYVEPYPPTGARYQVSKEAEDGHHPAWSTDGRELIYTPGPGNRLTAVPVVTTPSFSFGEGTAIPRPFTNAPPTNARTYDVTDDSWVSARMSALMGGRSRRRSRSCSTGSRNSSSACRSADRQSEPTNQRTAGQNPDGRSAATAIPRSSARPARASVPSSNRRPMSVTPCGTRRGGENVGSGLFGSGAQSLRASAICTNPARSVSDG
jgi:serine/threonine-protein kinase